MTRLLERPFATSLAEHQERHGPLPLSPDLVAAVTEAGLRGRGGAGFPTGRKMAAVRDRPARSVLVANATEGEPASAKDKALVRLVPHLVLDGMVAAAGAVGAGRAILCVDRRDKATLESAIRAVDERAAKDAVRLEVAATPSRYVAGEETALVAWLNGGESKPTFTPPRPYEQGVSGAPTLLDNAETLAHVGLIARVGAAGWRSAGAPEEPGTMLVTLAGALGRPGVYEVETGTPIRALLDQSEAAAAGGVLVGGYFGAWITADEADGAVMSRDGLAPVGASPGCGVLAVLPQDHCPLQEVSAVLRWLATNSAGQCGPCVNGLPALAGAFDRATQGNDVPELDRWARMIEGRGGCKLPDGAVRFLDSARRVFAGHLDQHRGRGPCPANACQFLPTPALGPWR